MFVLTHNQAKQVLVRESKKVRKAVIKYIETLEQAISNMIDNIQPSYQISDPVERARAWANEQEQQLNTINQLEQTKAQINDKRTATIMGKLGGITKAKNNLEIKLDESHTYATIRKMNKKYNKTFNWQKLKLYSINNKLPIKKIHDEIYDTVNSYHKDAWKNIYKVIIK